MLLLLIKTVDVVELRFDEKIAIQTCQLYKRSELSAQKSDGFGLWVELKSAFKITITKSDFL